MVYKSINQIFDGDIRLIDDFTDADLSNLDLSHIKPEAWAGANFRNTNFKGTNIRFYPDDLKPFYMYEFLKDYPEYQYNNISGCDFEDCDLSYLEDSDFFSLIIEKCNFKNTGLNIDFTNPKLVNYKCYSYNQNKLFGVTLPTSYSRKEKEYWDYIDIDIEFLRKNPTIEVSSGKVMELIKKSLSITRNQLYTVEEYHGRVEYAKKIMEQDRQGYLKKFYNEMKPYLKNIVEEEQFFLGEIIDKSFDECNFKRLHLSLGFNTIKDLQKKDIEISSVLFSRDCNIDEVQVPITIHNWDNQSSTRILNSEITYQTNLYVELNRICNMKCKFCRNQGLENQKYDYHNIIKNLKIVYENINNIVIGGGEPTLLLDDLKRLIKDVTDDSYSGKFSIITNGSLSIEDYESLGDDYIFYMSRHAIEDEENRAIFGDSKHALLSADQLEVVNQFTSGNSILCCTCFKGGVDTKDKMINYIKFA
ncbi:MAG: radical SAM protein [Bacilli bacterium]|nr:radical SAM protein [Bacilli bacterium]